MDIINNKGEVRRATFLQLKKVTPMEALITKIPINIRYGRQAKYLKSTLPEVLREVTRELKKKRVTVKPIPETPSPFKINSLKQGVSGKKTKRKLVKTVKSLSWRNRLHPRKLKK